LHAQLATRDGPALCGADASNRLQRILQFARVVLELAPGGILRNECELDGVDEPGAQLPDLDLCEIGRQRGAQGVHLARDLIVFPVRIDVGLELDHDEGHAVGNRRFDLLDVVELRELVLDRLGDELLEVARVGAGVDGGDEVTRDLELGILLARHIREREPAERDETEERNQRELVAPDRELEGTHALSRDARAAAFHRSPARLPSRS
jgi:hypothetical protein